jgi:hypothetical protein
MVIKQCHCDENNNIGQIMMKYYRMEWQSKWQYRTKRWYETKWWWKRWYKMKLTMENIDTEWNDDDKVDME